MIQRAHGAEIEFGATINAGGATGGTPEDACAQIMRAVRAQVPHLGAASSGGVFFENGGCFYLDSGGHPEYCTPEVDHPTDCVRYLLAGEAMLRDVIASIRGEHGSPPPILLFKCNVDYQQPGVTWAAHESYEHAADLKRLPGDLIPHIASRVYLGAGGLDPRCPGIRFSLSPRVHYFGAAISGSSTHHRGLFHTRDESHSGNGRHRLHVICGDSLSSQTGLWLKHATTCLIVAMSEGGLEPGADVQLDQPVSAMHAFAVDPTLRATARLTSGREVTALEVQHHYLRCAERHLDHACMPDWAPQAVELWRRILTRAERGCDGLDRTLDWAIKHSLMMTYARRRGVDPRTLPHWNHVLSQLRMAAARARCRKPFGAELILAPRGPLREEVKRLDFSMRLQGLEWDQVRDVLALRPRLCELDIRYGQVFPAGLFSTLEPDLDHRVPGVDPIDAAHTTAPARTRAALRGRYVRRFSRSRRNRDSLADWQFISTPSGHRLVMSDSSGRGARWERATVPLGRAMGLLDEVSTLYNRGDILRCHELLTSSLASRRRITTPSPAIFQRYLAWVQSRLGHLDEALETLATMQRSGVPESVLVMEHVCAYRFHGLRPSRPELWTWIERGDAMLDSGAVNEATKINFLGHKGYALGRAGRLDEAEQALRRACEGGGLSNNQLRFQARSFADLADVLRIRGRREDAASWLDRAAAVLRLRHFPGERADALLATQARLDADGRDLESARRHLATAKRTQRRLGAVVGLARTLLIEARIATTRWTAGRRLREVTDLRRHVPDLRDDPLLERILDRWRDWWQGAGTADGEDFFWGV